MNLKSVPFVLATIALFLCPWGASAAAQPYTLEMSLEPSDGGAYHVEPDQTTYDHGTAVIVYAVALPGFEFVGWEGDIAAHESVLMFPMVADTSLTAVFQVAAEVIDEFQLSVVSEPQEAGYVTRDPAGVAYDPGAAVTLTAVPDHGHVFAGWSGDVPEDADLGQAELQVTMDDDREITAHFEAAAGVAADQGGILGSAGCGALGILFWPITILGLATMRKR